MIEQLISAILFTIIAVYFYVINKRLHDLSSLLAFHHKILQAQSEELDSHLEMLKMVEPFKTEAQNEDQAKKSTKPKTKPKKTDSGMKIVLEGEIFLEETDSKGKVTKHAIDGKLALGAIMAAIEKGLGLLEDRERALPGKEKAHHAEHHHPSLRFGA